MVTIREIPFGDLMEGGNVSYGIVQPGVVAHDGIPIVRVGDIRNGHIEMTNPLKVERSISAKYGRTVLQGGELLISLVGTVGETAVVPQSMAGWNVARAVAVARPSEVSSQWLHFAFQTPTVRDQVRSVLNTTVQATLNLSDLKRIRIPYLTLPHREAIAEVLGALDDKIAANTKLADTCFELASAMYRSAVLSSPDRHSLSSIARHVPGKFLKRVDYVADGAFLVHGSNSIMGRTDKSFVEGGFAALARIGSSCGKFAWSESPAWVNNNASGVLPQYGVHPMILRHALGDIDMDVHRIGTGQPFIQMNSLFSTEVTVPRRSVHERLGEDLQRLASVEFSLPPHTDTLAEIRDTLLPQLMSGKLRVRDAERTVSEVL